MNGLVLSLLLACGPFFPISYFPSHFLLSAGAWRLRLFAA